MRTPSRQVIVLGATVLLGTAVGLMVVLSEPGPVEMAFWFEPISDDIRGSVPDRLAGGISTQEMALIETIAREEVARGFRDYPVSLSTDRRGTYRVRVVERLKSRALPPSGQSHLIVGLGGQGFVNFEMLAYGAITYAPPDAPRDEILAGIGRGIGRAAVHEFAHQLLGGAAQIHSSEDEQSYEYESASRPEQYYGPVRWDIAGPMLRKRFGLE